MSATAALRAAPASDKSGCTLAELFKASVNKICDLRSELTQSSKALSRWLICPVERRSKAAN
jgi:hypothetical protein